MTLSLPPDDMALLEQAPLFSEMGRDDLLRLLGPARLLGLPRGGPLFAEGDPANRFFMVLEGRIDLFTLTAGGERSIIEVIEAGHTFAEAAMFADANYPLTAEASAATRLIEIPARPFLDALAGNARLTARLLASLASWQRHLWAEITGLKSRTPAQRLGLFLLGRARDGGFGPGAEVTLPMTKSELASRIGVKPESLSRALARLRPLGVSTQGRQVRIGDVEALRTFCVAGENA